MNKTFESTINPLYKSITEQIHVLINKDQTNDLELYLQESTPLKYSTENETAFIKKPTIPFPELLKRFIGQSAINCKFGSLPNINHIWLSTGSSLYLWNLSAQDGDVFRYDCNQLIENVDLVVLPTHYELFVSTRDNIYLHAIDQSNEKKIRLVSKSTATTYGVVMSNVVTTNTKRVFAKGDDGHLYELNIGWNNADGYSNQCKITCHTVNRLLNYLPSIFKSRPTEFVKSFVLDDAVKFLFVLLSDSSICAVNIQGEQYLPMHKHAGKNLESIHLISSGKDKSQLMAIGNNGDRYYFTFEEPTIFYKHIRPAPPISGSLLFNRLSKESIDLSLYHQGVFAATLCKSENNYLVLTSADIIETPDNNHCIIENVYHELVQKKIWSIFENRTEISTVNFKSDLKSPKSFNSPISVITESGITQYIKQRPIDYLKDVLSSDSPSTLLNILSRYGNLETTYLAFALACTSEPSKKVADFINQSASKEIALLLYFSRIVNTIWNFDIKQSDVPKDEFKSVRKDLEVLINTIYKSHIQVKSDTMDLIIRAIESISFIGYMHDFNWDHLTENLFSNSTDKYTFAEFVTTDNGSLLAQNVVFNAITSRKLSDMNQKLDRIGVFLNKNCLAFFGNDVVVYFKAFEYLHSAQDSPEISKQALDASLDHLNSIISCLDLSRIDEISRKYCELGYYDHAVKLAFAKYKSGTASLSNIHDILFSIISTVIEKESEKDAQQVITNAIGLYDQEEYHFEFYNWLLDNRHKSLLITLETPTLVNFIKTQMKNEAESLACLETYYAHRKQFDLAIDCLYQLATKVQGLPLKARIVCLRKATDHLSVAVGLDKDVVDRVNKAYQVAKIQQDIYNILSQMKSEEANRSVAELNQVLYTQEDLLNHFAYTHSLHEKSLVLLDMMDTYNWKYVNTAWIVIIKACQNQNEVKHKVKSLADILYPSIPSFPVYTIYQILKETYKEAATTVLLEAGVPKEVISDAEKAFNTK